MIFSYVTYVLYKHDAYGCTLETVKKLLFLGLGSGLGLVHRFLASHSNCYGATVIWALHERPGIIIEVLDSSSSETHQSLHRHIIRIADLGNGENRIFEY
jgi:hypothetical protein